MMPSILPTHIRTADLSRRIPPNSAMPPNSKELDPPVLGAPSIRHGHDIIASFRNNVSDLIILVYVDDCIILGRDKVSIDDSLLP